MNDHRMIEKKELIHLRNRFESYVSHVREFREDNGGGSDAASVYRTVELLEEEVRVLKASYESQIGQLKLSVDLLVEEKAQLEKDNDMRRRSESHLLTRLTSEASTNHKLVDEITSLQRELGDKDQKLRNAGTSMNRSILEANDFQAKYTSAQQEVDNLSQKLHEAQMSHRESEAKISLLEEKLAHQPPSSDDHRDKAPLGATEPGDPPVGLHHLGGTDADGVGCSSSGMIAWLQTSGQQGQLPEILDRVRSTYEEELRNFTREAEMDHKRHLMTFKNQLEAEIMNVKHLQEENKQLRDEILKLRKSETHLVATTRSLEQQVELVERNLDIERGQAVRQITDLEGQLREVTLNRSIEVNAARESEVPLRAEIEGLRALIDEEEKRLNIFSLSRTLEDKTAVPPENNGLPNSCLSLQKSRGTVGLSRAEENTNASAAVDSCSQLAAASRFAYPSTAAEPPVNSCCFPAAVDNCYPQPLYEGEGESCSAALRATSATSELADLQQQQQHSASPLLLSTTAAGGGQHIHGIASPRTAVHVGPIQAWDHQQRQQSSSPAAATRAQSAPVRRTVTSAAGSYRTGGAAGRGKGDQIEYNNIGYIRDYFDEMFNGGGGGGGAMSAAGDNSMLPEQFGRTKPGNQMHFNSSAVGDVKFAEVNAEGKSVRLINCGAKDAELGGFMIQQNIGGHPVAMYRFPPRTKFPAGGTVSVWAGCVDPSVHRPPTDFFWPEYYRWKTGPECTTILCQPSGQAIAWTTATHRIIKNAFVEERMEQRRWSDSVEDTLQKSVPDTTALKREKLEPAFSKVQRNQSNSTTSLVNSCAQSANRTTAARPGSAAINTSGGGRQRSMTPTSITPMGVVGTGPQALVRQNSAPHSGGGGAQKGARVVGGRVFRYFQGSQKKSYTIGNRAPEMMLRSSVEPPNAFQTPHTRLQAGVNQLQSLMTTAHITPLPHPPNNPA